jgi:signal transduction histidine kinase
MVADVDDIKYRRVKTTVATLPSKWSGKLNQLIILSYPLQNILTGLERLEATGICVVDKYRRVRTATASALDSGRICDKSNANSEQLINAVLNGQSQLEIYSQQPEQGNQTKIIVTAEPVYLNKAVIGAVLLEKNSQDIFQSQRKTIDQLGAIALVVFLIIAAFLLRLSYRVMRFNNELNYAINSEGRLVTTEIQSEKTANDNLGDLSRSVSELLLQLKRYTHFLETIPRILRHEILNPVNAISLGVQQLQSSSVITKGSVQKIQTSVAQLELIVSRLTEAAHIEEALITDSFETIDLINLINEYVENIQMLHPKSKFNFIRPKGRVSAKMSPLRFVQMLDKIKDNAVRFTKDTGSITFAITVHHQQVQLLISNDGPLIPKEVLSTLLMGMFTSKTSRYDQPHLGIGLYIARHIADSHQAHIQINNRDDRSGVEVLIKIGIAT